MLFLLNDAVISTRHVKLSEAFAPTVRALSFEAVARLGQELFAAEPLLHYVRSERAERLAALLRAKAPQVNAAHFLAPRAGCKPHEVRMQFAMLGFELMVDLYRRQRDGELSTLWIDKTIWRRLAA
jgi:hypothetical protein